MGQTLAGILSGTHLGRSMAPNRSEQISAPGLLTSQYRDPGRPASSWASGCHQQVQSRCAHTQATSLAILCKVTSPVTWCLDSRGDQWSRCPGAEIPRRFFLEAREEKPWQQNPRCGWGWVTSKSHTNPPPPTHARCDTGGGRRLLYGA